MVYRLIDEHLPLDEVVFYDTGMEFDSIYKNWNDLSLYAQQHGIKCVTLYPEQPFLYTMFEKPVVSKKDKSVHYGYSWCGHMCRWGTTAKLKAIDRYCEQTSAMCYVGIAADETARLTKERKQYKLFPLADWGMSEADCLSYCRSRGISWMEQSIDLYDYLDRVSCWCCANKNLWELYNIWKHLPNYWNKLKDMQSKTTRPFNGCQSIFEIEERFTNGYIPKHRTKGNKNAKSGYTLHSIPTPKVLLENQITIEEILKRNEV